MKVIAIKHKSFTGGLDEYLDKIAIAVLTNPDMVVGADYSLCFLKKDGSFDLDLFPEIQGKLEEISATAPNTLILPGTTPIALGSKKMGHSAFAFIDGKLVGSFRKDSDYGNREEALERNGLEYESGDSSQNFLTHNGKKIAIEICSDHGKQRVNSANTDIEVIHAYDRKAGFWIRGNNNLFSRFAVLCDGFAPKVGAFHYDPSRKKRYGVIKGEELNNSNTLFDLTDERAISYF